ncbi:ABC transporter ATP-binding protein [Clostridium botulinum]|uniref:Peptide ABC transporter ATP-binding protein n=1 Tax=Clostridium botulinum C/D str. DC5 TaxID=1443128 RepID=A0A0A0I8K9_CLOBO|nr:ABC transporter ATP-binding protein [Clostridium botulinum]KEI01911.1 peptide ABC transporter ATP-binding protein [Clostridium botulinum C/D str. BKT75002]KEI10013.1 peptide ABC transporter ATP-binding protein [Clostridium botulinum C/D str. BKT2873]KGM96000.1 peptide ABC transporter ATP-binding protein [Clostridium botulinum C/D str. DC5]KOC54930.1 peptide ABC transporter ATP-binding protein [Clostridium botulinum]KOC58335.1 peptide ABC transporter ATP-binding protein [Clostridium botulinu
MSYIQLIDIIKEYGCKEEVVHALNKINFNVEKGEMIAVLGTSGSGKSTLLNLIGCLDKCTGGRYLLDGKDITNYNDTELAITRNMKIGFIFQNFSLITDYNVIENVEMPLVYRNLLLGKDKKLNKHEIKDLALRHLKEVGMDGYANKKISKLSGGQQQRVAIARALVNTPDIILADEPTGSLDKSNSLNIINILKSINKTINTTIIVVTHDEQIAKFCDRIIRMEDGVIINSTKM